MNWPLNVHQGTSYGPGPTSHGRNTASGKPHLLVGLRDGFLWGDGGLVAFPSSLCNSGVHPTPGALPLSWPLQSRMYFPGCGQWIWSSYSYVLVALLIIPLHLGPLFLCYHFLQIPAFCSERPPHKHLHACHPALLCPQRSLPSALCLPHCREGWDIQVMLPQLPREDGWWETKGQARSGNSGCCHCNSNLTWEVCYHLSIAVILQYVSTQNPSRKALEYRGKSWWLLFFCTTA